MSERVPRRRAIATLGGTALAAGAALVAPSPARAWAGASTAGSSAAATWKLRWSPEANVDGLSAFEGVEDDRADSHPAGQPHIFVTGNNFRFNMHTVDRDSSTDRQRQEVKGMHAGGADLVMDKGETWRFTQSMYIPGSLKATTTFTHIMQMKMPGSGSSPILVQSLRRRGSTPTIELVVTAGNVRVGSTGLAPLQDKWIDVELELTIGDSGTGKVRWALHDGGTTVIDVNRSNVDTWLDDRVRPKWGIYRSLGDTSGSLQNCYLLLTKMRAYQST